MYLSYSFYDSTSESLNPQVLGSRCNSGCGLQNNQHGLDGAGLGSGILGLIPLKVGLVMIRLEIVVNDTCHLLCHM